MTNPRQTVAFLVLASAELRRIADASADYGAGDLAHSLRGIADKCSAEAADLEACLNDTGRQG